MQSIENANVLFENPKGLRRLHAIVTLFTLDLALKEMGQALFDRTLTIITVDDGI
jgi:hypothetical protein